MPARAALLAIVWLAAAVTFAIAGEPWPAVAAGIVAGCCGARWRRTPLRVTAPAPAPPEHRNGQLDAVLTSVTEGVLLVDRDGIVRSASPVATSLLRVRLPPDSAPRLPSLVPWPQLELAVAACLARGEPQRFEGAFAAGEQLTLGVHVAPWRRDGELAGVVIVLEDLSRLRQLEAHRRDFVANVSHELKTPLAAIQGFVETMLDDQGMSSETQRRFLERVAVQSKRLGTLVADLLTLSRLDEEPPGANAAEPCDLAAVVREVLAELTALAERKPLQLRPELPRGSVMVRAEREALRQVVSNLVDNAIKYTPAGGAVTVRLRGGPQAELDVIDTGIGLSPMDQERVFERFFRVDKARSRELGGTGLGLSIVKNTVRHLGGDIGVRSELGKGSTFWVRLPVAAG